MKTGAGIEWTGPRRWNPIVGCSRVTDGCRHCYAEQVALANVRKFLAIVEAAGARVTPAQYLTALYYCRAVRSTSGAASPWSGRAQIAWHKLLDPLLWRSAHLIFANSMSDVLHESLTDREVLGLVGLMACSSSTFQVLTKRPERLGLLRRMDSATLVMYAAGLCRRAPAAAADDIQQSSLGRLTAGEREALAERTRAELHARWLRAAPIFDAAATRGEAGARAGAGPKIAERIWWGVSISQQRDAERFLPPLLRARVGHRWASCEPLVAGDLDLTAVARDGSRCPWDRSTFNALSGERALEWVVVGGESVGPGQTARPFPLDCAERVVADCRAAGVPVFAKQLGAATERGGLVQVVDRAVAGRKGDAIEAAPPALQVREMPAALAGFRR